MDKFIYEVNIPNKGTYEVKSDRQLTDAQAYQYAMQQASGAVTQPPPVQAKPTTQTQKPMSTTEVLTGAVMNFPSSLYNMATDVASAVTDPLQTARDLGTLFVGTTSKVLGKPFFESDLDKQMRLKGIDSADKVGAFLANRYGSAENAKKALATDPAGVLSDASLLFTGGAGLLPKTSASYKAFSTAAKVTDPLTIAASPVTYGAKVLAPTLGTTTGAGTMAVQEAYQAGKEGGERGKSFVGNLRGTTDQPNNGICSRCNWCCKYRYAIFIA